MTSSILITGGTGYLGRALVRALLNDPVAPISNRGPGSRYDRICILSRGEHRQAEMCAELGNDRLRWFIGDVRDHHRLELATHGVDVVIHAAALKRIETAARDPLEAVLTNVLGTSNVVTACLRSKVAKLVLVSSDKAVEPTTLYGTTKACAEQLVLAANSYARTKCTVVRYGNISGSTGSVIERWRKDPARATITDPEATRFWMLVDDAAALVLRGVNEMTRGVLTPALPAYRLGDLALAMGFSKEIPLPCTGLGPGEKLHERMVEGGQDSSQVRRMSVAELREALEHV